MSRYDATDDPLCYPGTAVLKNLADLLDQDHLSQITDPATFAGRASYVIAGINAVHPFREGNGRCQLTLLNILMEISGFEMDEELLDPDGFMEAMIASFHGDNVPLTRSILTMAT